LVGLIELLVFLEKQIIQEEIMNLQVFTEKSTQVMTKLEQDLSNKGEEIKEITSILNELLNRSDVNCRLQEDILNQLNDVIHKLGNNFTDTKKIFPDLNQEIFNSKQLLEKLKSRRTLRLELQKLKAQVQEQIIDALIDNLFIEKIEELEISIKDSEMMIALLSSLCSLRVAITDHINWFKNLYESLYFMLEYLEEGRVLEDDYSITVLAKDLTDLVLIKNIRNYYLLESEANRQELNSYVASTILIAKSILWQIDQINLKRKKRFKTLNELWQYWDDKYTEEEMTETLKNLEEEKQ